jgi:hypothetical protein
MPGKAHIDVPGALQHIIIDRNDFLDRLEDILKDTSALCGAWAPGESASNLADKHRISQPAVSMSVKRWEEIVKDGYCAAAKRMNL